MDVLSGINCCLINADMPPPAANLCKFQGMSKLRLSHSDSSPSDQELQCDTVVSMVPGLLSWTIPNKVCVQEPAM